MRVIDEIVEMLKGIETPVLIIAWKHKNNRTIKMITDIYETDYDTVTYYDKVIPTMKECNLLKQYLQYKREQKLKRILSV